MSIFLAIILINSQGDVAMMGEPKEVPNERFCQQAGNQLVSMIKSQDDTIYPILVCGSLYDIDKRFGELNGKIWVLDVDNVKKIS